MRAFRDIRRKARLSVHERMHVLAAYIPLRGTPELVRVRDHTKARTNAIEGAVRSGNGAMVERQDAAPSIIFVRADLVTLGITPVKGGIVSIEPGEAYRLDNAQAVDDLTVRWYVTEIDDQSELASLVVPDDFPLPPPPPGGP